MKNFDIWGKLFRDISIRNKFYTSFFWITFFLLASYAGGFYSFNLGKGDARNIDVAGRTRMLSQKLYALSVISLNEDVAISNPAKTELAVTITTLDNIYDLFETGGSINKIENSTDVIKPMEGLENQNKLKEIRSVFEEHKRLCNVIINEPTYTIKTTIPTDPGFDLFQTAHDSVNTAKAASQKFINPKVKNAVNKLQQLAIEGTLLKNNQQLVSFFTDLEAHHRTMNQIEFIIFSIITCIVILFNFLLIQFYVVNPINKISKAASQIAEGNIKTTITHNIKDGLGKIVNSITTLASNLRKAAEFTVKIGEGHFDAKYDVVVAEGTDEKDNLSSALLNMRDRLKNVADEDKKRNWATEGFAKFGEILRSNSDDLKKLSDDIISHLVKYLNANQGSLFIVNDFDSKDVHLELTACYAWNRKKFLQKKIVMGEGLVGQVWQEGESVFMTDVPNDYVQITSGLGEANPNSILIAPLKINDKIFGILEIASFKPFEKFENEFVEKLGESIASTISGVKINARTKKLLEESQQMTEEMKAQEEEIRQNMEEMQATQEEMIRAQDEMKAMNTITDNVAIVSKTDLKGNITFVNDEFLKWSKYTREELLGKNHRILKSGQQPNELFVEMWKTISSGKVFRGEIKNKAKDGTYYWVDAVIAPILDKNGKIREYVAQRFVINEKKKKEEETQHMLEEVKAQEEELRQNLEEMQATQEEMNRVQAELQTQMNIVNATALVSKTDLKGNITYANDEFCRVAKYTREELIGKNHNIVRHPDMPKAAFEDLWKTISLGKVWRGQVKNKAKDGSHYWVNATIAPIIGTNGKPKEYMAVRYLITEAKEREEKLKERISKFEKQAAHEMEMEMEIDDLKKKLELEKKSKRLN